MKRNKLTSLAVAAALAASGGAYAGLLSKDEVKRAEERISADFKAAKQACDSRSGNAKDICMAQAKGNEKIAKLKFHRQGTCFRCGFTRENRANVARIRVQYVAMY